MEICLLSGPKRRAAREGLPGQVLFVDRLIAAGRLVPLETERTAALKLLTDGSVTEFCRAVLTLIEFLYLD